MHMQGGLGTRLQGGGTPLQSVLRAVTAVKIKVNNQLEIRILHSQKSRHYISLIYTVKLKRNFSDKTYNREIYAMPCIIIFRSNF